jgi:outer membrane receptor protein involved in Fe transport
MRPVRRIAWLLFLGLSVLLVAPASAQVGKLTGRVTEAGTRVPLAGATVVVEGSQRGAAADRDGYYVINSLPPGRYTVRVSLVGFSTVVISDVQIRIGLTTEQDFVLSEEIIQGEEVLVTAQRPAIQRDLTSSRALIDAEELGRLPVESVGAVVNLQAGVVGGHFRGGRMDEVAYLINGVSVTDPFSGGMGAEVETSAIQEIEVISGTFSAKYGQAMSGVVNIVTKEGAGRFGADASAYFGSFFTGRESIFPNLNKPTTPDAEDVQLSISGPLRFIDGLSFFTTGRYFNSSGHLYGRRVYNIWDGQPYSPTGDSMFVSMNPYRRYSANARVVLNRPSFKLSYSLFADDHFTRNYDHGYRLAPDGTMRHYRNNWLHQGSLTHVISSRTFHTLKYSHNYSGYRGHVYEDPFDTRYVDPLLGSPQTGYTYRYGGNHAGRYDRSTTTHTAQWQLQSQVSRHHHLDAGIEGRVHRIENMSREFQDMDQNSAEFDLGYPAVGTTFNQEYVRRPFEVSAYLEDKIEYDIMIVNAGVRFDYFNPNGHRPLDLRNPENNIEGFEDRSGYLDASPTMQFSPRLGASFPITETGAIHFAYGHFFQIPSFENLYLNNSFYVEKNRGLYTVMGNPELKPQKTAMYEAGIQQQLIPALILDLTVYYRDIRNLMGTEIIQTYNGFQYARFINRDYGNVRGFIVTLDRRFVDLFSAKIDYTYQIAEGNASDPRAVFYDNQTDPPIESEKKVVPLDWDQRHTLYLSGAVGRAGDWTAGLTWRLGSGMPYTSDLTWNPVNIRIENDKRRPITSVVDLRAEKQFNFRGARASAFLLVYNVLDRLNEYGVYASSGRAGRDLNALIYGGTIVGLNTLDEFVNNPSMYSEPRQIRLGFAIGF